MFVYLCKVYLQRSYMFPHDRWDTGPDLSDSDILQLGRENTHSDQVGSDILQLGREYIDSGWIDRYILQQGSQNSGFDLSDLDAFLLHKYNVMVISKWHSE